MLVSGYDLHLTIYVSEPNAGIIKYRLMYQSMIQQYEQREGPMASGSELFSTPHLNTMRAKSRKQDSEFAAIPWSSAKANDVVSWAHL